LAVLLFVSRIYGRAVIQNINLAIKPAIMPIIIAIIIANIINLIKNCKHISAAKNSAIVATTPNRNRKTNKSIDATNPNIILSRALIANNN
jgi:chromate transport protein ChrA